MNYDLSTAEKVLFETIRLNNNSNKSILVEKSNLPWSTVSSALSSLSKKGWIELTNNSRETVKLKCSSTHFLGISVGTSNIKVVLTNILCETIDNSIIEFQTINNNISEKFNIELNEYKVDSDSNKLMWCFKTPNDFIKLSQLLSDICEIVLNECEEITIASICFVFPGIIDSKNQKIIISNYSNQSIEATNIREILNTTVLELIDTRKIKLYIEHNVKASTLYEYSYLSKENFSDLNYFSTIYLGFGIGIGNIINGMLIRGSQNRAGQFGHTRIPIFTDEYIDSFYKDNKNNYKLDCYSGSECMRAVVGCDTLENVLRKKVFYHAIDSEYVIKSDNEQEMRDKYKNTKLEILTSKINDNSNLKNTLAFYIGYAISEYTKIFPINTIVFSGKLSTIFEAIRTELKLTLMKFHSDINMISSKNGEFSAALGAAEIAIKNTFELLEE